MRVDIIPRLLLVFALTAATGSAKDLYIAQNSAGANTGADCADALAWSAWTVSGNWLPGNTLHICGTYTGSPGSTAIASLASGSAGNPITIKFENGALLAAPYWSVNGAIAISNNYITVNGGANGKIQNTLNGTPGGACLGGACTQQQSSEGIVSTGNNTIIENLIVTHIYVKTEDVNDGAGDSNTGIETDGSNEIVTNNTIDNVYTGIVNGGTNISTIEFSFNTLTFCNHCIKSAISSGAVTGLLLHDNNISSMYNWDQPDNHYHHNGIFVFGDPAGTQTGYIYNNYIHGLNSRDATYGASHITALIFLEFNNPSWYVFNNVLELDPDAGSTALNYPANGYITGGGTSSGNTQYIYNNTIVGGDNGGNCFAGGLAGLVIENNIMQNCGNPIYNATASSPFTSDYNLYYMDSGDGWANGGGIQTSFSLWQSSCSCDLHSQFGNNPNLGATYTLQTGSPAIAAALNLTSVGVIPLDADKAGIGRPFAGAWTAGAYQSGGVLPPTALTLVVQ